MLTDGRIFVHLLYGGWLLSEKSSPKSLAVEVSLALSFPTPTADGPSQLCFLTAPSSPKRQHRHTPGCHSGWFLDAFSGGCSVERHSVL